MDIDQLKAIIEVEISNSEYNVTGSDDTGNNSGSMETAMDYYNGARRGDEVAGRSQIQSLDVADMIESVIAQVMPMLDTKTLATFNALNVDDQKQAEQEAKFCNHVLMDENNGYIILEQAVKDIMLLRNGIIKVYNSERHTLKREKYENIEPAVILKLEQSKKPDEELYLDQETGDVVRTKIIKKLAVEVVPVEEFIYHHHWDQVSLADCPFVGHHKEVYRKDLVEMGFDPEVINSLSSGQTFVNTHRLIRDTEQINNTINRSIDSIDFYELYMVVDFDDDGYSEMYRIYYADRQILDMTVVDFHPFAGGVANIMPHRFRGISVFDKQKSIQDSKTFILRQWMDNMNHINNNRLEVEMKNIIDPNDLVDSRPSGFVKTRRIGSVAPIPVLDIGQSCANALQYLDKVRTDRSGASLDMQGENMQLGDQRTAHGAERLISSKEQIAALATRNISETIIREVFLLIHKTLRLSAIGDQSRFIAGEWMTTDPAHWPDRQHVKVTVGSSQGERNATKNALIGVMDQQMKAMQAGQGDILVNEANAYSAVIDYATACGLQHPEKYWTDPASPPAQQAKKFNQEKAKEQEEIQKRMQRVLSDNEILKTKVAQEKNHGQMMMDSMKLQLDEAKAAIAAAEADENLTFDYVQHYDNLAMQLTAMETQYNTEADYKSNKGETTGA